MKTEEEAKDREMWQAGMIIFEGLPQKRKKEVNEVFDKLAGARRKGEISGGSGALLYAALGSAAPSFAQPTTEYDEIMEGQEIWASIQRNSEK